MVTKTIKLIKPWGLHPAGKVFATDVAAADLLIQSGRAKEVEEKKPQDKGKQGRKN